MSRLVADTLDTRAAGWIHRVFLLEEEHRPLPADPSAAMLVARVSERLSLAAAAIDDAERPLLDVAVHFLGAAAFALTAVARIDPDRNHGGVAQRKDALLESLDQDVLGKIETEHELLEQASADEYLRRSLSALTSAYQAVTELEEEDLEADECEGDDWLREQIVDSLWDTAVISAAAGERLVERHESSAGRASS